MGLMVAERVGVDAGEPVLLPLLEAAEERVAVAETDDVPLPLAVAVSEDEPLPVIVALAL